MHALLHFQFITFNLVGNLNVLHNIPIMDHPFKTSAKFRDFFNQEPLHSNIRRLCSVHQDSKYVVHIGDQNASVVNRYRTLFPFKPDPMPSFFRHTLRSRIQNLNLFWVPQKQERKNNHNYTIFWAKHKIRMNFLWNKLFKFLLLNDVLKNLIFFSPTNFKKLAI